MCLCLYDSICVCLCPDIRRDRCVYVCAACVHYFCLFIYSVFLSGTSYKCINHTKEKKMFCTNFGLVANFHLESLDG